MVSGLDNFKVGWVVDLTESTPCERAQNKVKKRKKVASILAYRIV